MSNFAFWMYLACCKSVESNPGRTGNNNSEKFNFLFKQHKNQDVQWRHSDDYEASAVRQKVECLTTYTSECLLKVVFFNDHFTNHRSHKVNSGEYGNWNTISFRSKNETERYRTEMATTLTCGSLLNAQQRSVMLPMNVTCPFEFALCP